MNIVTPMAVGSSIQTIQTTQTIQTRQQAKHQACKVSINDDAAWRIYNRLDSRNATGPPLRASMVVREGGAGAADSWISGRVRRGELARPLQESPAQRSHPKPHEPQIRDGVHLGEWVRG